MQLAEPGRFESVSIPQPRDIHDGEVLLRLLSGAICGSDIPNFQGRISLVMRDTAPGVTTLPGYPMHEVVGEVVASGDPALNIGDRVVGWATKADGLAECLVTRSDSVVRYCASLSPAEAVLIQPLACALYTVDRLGVAGEKVAVIGLGPLGLMMAHAAKTGGARSVTGVDRVDRRGIAERFGVDTFVHSMADRWAENIKDEERPSAIIEAAGHQVATLHNAVSAAAIGGRIFYFGIPDDEFFPFPVNLFLRRQLTLTSGGVQDRQRWLRTADAYLAEHPELLTCITDVFDVREAQEAYDRASLHSHGRLKVVLTVGDAR